MTTLTDDDIWFLERMTEQHSNSGYLVETKQGEGRTYHKDDLINGKLAVYLSDGRKMLCSVENVKIKGFID